MCLLCRMGGLTADVSPASTPAAESSFSTVQLPCNLMANKAGGRNQNTESEDQEGQSVAGSMVVFSLTSEWSEEKGGDVFLHAVVFLILMHITVSPDAQGLMLETEAAPNSDAWTCHISSTERDRSAVWIEKHRCTGTCAPLAPE